MQAIYTTHILHNINNKIEINLLILIYQLPYHVLNVNFSLDTS